MLYFLRIFAAPIFLNTFLHWKILWNQDLFPNQNDDIIWHKASILKRICQENYPRESLGKIWNFTIYSVVIAMLYIMTKLNVILKLELVIVQICPHWQEKGSKEKSAIKDHCFFVSSYEFLWWIYRFMSQANFNAWKNNLYYLPSINYYWINIIA